MQQRWGWHDEDDHQVSSGRRKTSPPENCFQQQFRVCSSAASDGQSCELHSSHPQKGSDTCVARTTLTFYNSPHVDRGNGEHSRKGAEGHAEAYRGQDCRLGYWESYRGEVQRRECKRCLLSEARRKTFSRQAKSARRHAARFRVVPQFQHASPLFSHGNAMMYTCSLFGLEFRDRIKIADTRWVSWANSFTSRASKNNLDENHFLRICHQKEVKVTSSFTRMCNWRCSKATYFTCPALSKPIQRAQRKILIRKRLTSS